MEIVASTAEGRRKCSSQQSGDGRAHSEGGVVGEMLQVDDQNRSGSRAVGRTARVMVQPER